MKIFGTIVFGPAIVLAATVDSGITYDGNFPDRGQFFRRSIFDNPQLAREINSDNLLRRYKHLERLISFYDQSLTNITRYWSYGCWCFQMGDNPLRLGNGKPVDDIDKRCKKHKECYKCANIDHKIEKGNGSSCLPEETGYQFEASIDAVTGQPVVSCLHPTGSCKRNLCECDKSFAANLKISSDNNHWNHENSQFSGFDQRQSCLARIKPPGGKDKDLQCCGAYPNRSPFHANVDGSRRQCCNNVQLYDEKIADCCDGRVVSNGSC